ncbi:hypothetical protein K503DRAFT_218600 [Rhizopogon vinicolor AM-OR11-026]|uniref:Uncharacterized protein n=1 Tax=Rhizopogon vinicolor AM-OR11-026 TaxID=1314800 RepID=A0A1B7MYJ5_9AGAM|nr:hypothetical protein K503DRAFT_218600 [Rhizopogon vinicolor AM-OR11-026]
MLHDYYSAHLFFQEEVSIHRRLSFNFTISRFICSSSPPLVKESSDPERKQPQDVGETHLSEGRQVTVTTIRVHDLTLGLRRIPAGFYVTVQVDDVQWQTTNKPVHVDLNGMDA